MEENDQLSRMKALSDEVLRKIGRNVLLFQQIEGLLKLLVANHRADDTPINLMERRGKWAGVIKSRRWGN